MDMGHLDHLQRVADEDVRHLLGKERTYKGSWKRRGGVGAFMMLARKWDRLEGILETQHKFDVFDGINCAAGGEDGTVLAEVRDLRRYLLLVEAEMVSRGVIKMATDHFSNTTRTLNETARSAVVPVVSDTIGSSRVILKECADAIDKINDKPAERPDRDGSQHATLTPWMVSMRWRMAHGMTAGSLREKLFDEWWRQVGPGVWALEANVVGPASMPAEIDGMYEPAEHGWTVKIERCPPDVREHFPRLQEECNHKELISLPMWQQDLYHWRETDGKYVVENKAWIREI